MLEHLVHQARRDVRSAATPRLTLASGAGADVVGLALRFRALTAVEGMSAEPPPLAESEQLEGAEEPAVLDDDERAEQRAIRKLSVEDAALRTLRLAQQTERGGKRPGPSRASVPAAKKASAPPKAARASVAERAGPADSYEQKLVAACADFKGSEGRQFFKERLARNLERLGVEVRRPRNCSALGALTPNAMRQAPPTFSGMKLDLHKLFMQVVAAGGAAAVSKEGAWSRVMSAAFSTADAPPGAAAQLRLLYEQVLLAFEHRCVKKAETPSSKCVCCLCCFVVRR